MLGMFMGPFGEDEDDCDNDRLYEYTTNALRCNYVLSHDECKGESLINYYEFFYCGLKENYIVFGILTVF